jgi:polar amino acid transport system substrate-binding protein
MAVMKAVEQSYRGGAPRVVEAPAPIAPAGGFLVATTASLISAGTEKQIIDLARASLAGKAIARPDLARRTLTKMRQEGVAPTLRKVFAKLDTPIPLGYSLAGRVVELGRDASGFAVGDRIACAGAGIANHAEYNAVPRNLCVRIPDGVTDEDASFVTLGAIALQGLRVAQPILGERFVVLGLGLIGQLTVQLLKANGCRVLGYDPNEARVQLARDLGADAAVSSNLIEAADAFTEGRGADGVIVTASTKSSAPLNQAAEISRLKGRVVLLGLTGATLDRDAFYKRELDLRLSMSYGPGRHDPSYEQDGQDYPFAYVRWTEQRNMAAFLELVATGAVTPGKLVTHRYPISDAENAYGVLDSDTPYLAIVLTYPEASGAPARLVETRKQATSSGDIGIGFIGFGNYARGVLAPAVQKAGGVRFTTIATATALSARNGADKFGFAAATTEAKAVLQDSATQAVFIATRHSSHAALATDALRAGKHVFLEKPAALNESELSALSAAAKASPGVLAVGFNRRYAPLLVQAKAALTPRTGPLVMSYRINAGKAPAGSWLFSAEGGGRVIGEVCHFIDAMTFLCGAPPTEASAIGARGHDDAVSVLLKFADGSTGAIVYSSLGEASAPKEHIEAFADGRVVQIDDFRKLTIYASGRRRVKTATQDKGQSALVAAFLNAARKGGESPTVLDDIEAVTRATFAIEVSLRTGAAQLVG